MKTLEQEVAERLNEIGLPRIDDLGYMKAMQRFFDGETAILFIKKDGGKTLNLYQIPIQKLDT